MQSEDQILIEELCIDITVMEMKHHFSHVQSIHTLQAAMQKIGTTDLELQWSVRK